MIYVQVSNTTQGGAHLQLLDLAGLPLHVLADLAEHLLEMFVQLQQPSNLVRVCSAPPRYPQYAALRLRQVHLCRKQMS